MFIVGDKEKEQNGIAVRTRKGVDLGIMSKKEIYDKLVAEDKNKVIE